MLLRNSFKAFEILRILFLGIEEIRSEIVPIFRNAFWCVSSRHKIIMNNPVKLHLKCHNFFVLNFPKFWRSFRRIYIKTQFSLYFRFPDVFGYERLFQRIPDKVLRDFSMRRPRLKGGGLAIRIEKSCRRLCRSISLRLP